MPGSFRSSGRAGGRTSHGRWLRSDPGPCFMDPGRAQSTARSPGPEDRRNRAPCAHFSQTNIGLSVPALVLTFDSREKVLDRIVARSVPGRFGLAQVESSAPPAQLSTDCWG